MRGVFIEISWKFDIIFIRYILHDILSKANKKKVLSYLRSLRQRYVWRSRGERERILRKETLHSLLSSARTPFILYRRRGHNSLPCVYVMRTCVGFVRLHHANDVTRAKYAPMASHTPWTLQTDEYIPFVRPGSSLRILKSFLPDTVIRNWNNLAIVTIVGISCHRMGTM